MEKNVNERLDKIIKRLKDFDNDLEQILLLGNDIEDIEYNFGKLIKN